MVQIPVYAFTGFLDSGKTKFIQETLEDERFNAGERTLLLVFEDGDEEYDFSTYPHQNVFLEMLDQQTVTPDQLQALSKKHNVKTFALVANMSIAAERRDLLQQFDCVICNQQEAGILFLDDYEGRTPEEMRDILADRIVAANIPSMVVTMGAEGSVFANLQGKRGVCPAKRVQVKDTTGAGDSFCAGVAIGMTYGKTIAESVEIGTTLAASVITSSENVCPGLDRKNLVFSYKKPSP